MNLINIKECSKCINSLVYGNSDNMEIQCISEDHKARELFDKDGRCSAKFCECFVHSDKSRNGGIKQENAFKFILAGNSDFILHSTKTNEDFRFMLTMQESKEEQGKYLYFVNTIKANSKIYCGIIWFDNKAGEFKYAQGNKGQLPGASIEIRSLLFVLNKLYSNDTVNFLEVYSVGKCGHCSKPLTTINDMETGIHKKCNSELALNKIFKNDENN